MNSPGTIEMPASALRFEDAEPVLDRINWNFSAATAAGFSNRPFDCRKHHWYPATFIPEIPYTLIELLSSKGASVYDPFAGSGTTVFQALQLGRTPYATELCKVAIDFMSSLWILLRPSSNLSNVSSRIGKLLTRFDEHVDYAGRLKDSKVLVSKLRPWFAPKTFREVTFLIEVALRERDLATKAALRICISNLLKTACAQDRGWGCVADNVFPKPEQKKNAADAISLLRRKVARLVDDIEALRATLSASAKKLISDRPPERHLIQADVRHETTISDRSIDLVVTSPPYPNMTDYCLSQRLSYYWLGSDPADDLAYEIGARRRRSAADCLDLYREGMKQAETAIAKKLKRGGYACFVMPGFEGDKWNNAARKKVVQDCLAHLHTCGLVLQQELTRMLPLRRRHHNQKWTTLERENIYIFSKVA